MMIQMPLVGALPIGAAGVTGMINVPAHLGRQGLGQGLSSRSNMP